MVQEVLFVTGIVSAVLAGICLFTAVSMFFGFRIPSLIRNLSGSLEQRQIEEIRKNSAEATRNRGKINVFENLEKKAKVKRTNTASLNMSTTTGGLAKSTPAAGTTVLNAAPAPANPNFVIEKNMVFVSTNEVFE